MDSEKQQRVQQRELIGDTLEAEDLHLEHTVKRNNKSLTVIKKTPCAFVKDLKETIITYVEDNARYCFNPLIKMRLHGQGFSHFIQSEPYIICCNFCFQH